MSTPVAKRLVDTILKDERIVVGLMSGTSADGVDIVAVELKGHEKNIRHKILHKDVVPYHPELRSYILQTLERGVVKDVCILNFLVAEFFSKALKDSLENSSIKISEIDLIGSHGQTIYHFPEYFSTKDLSSRCTLQIGSTQVIAERTGRIVVGNFRIRDIAAGGQGAPIIAYVDYVLLSDPKKGRIIQNIGGIANATVIPANASRDEIYAFDTGPGNSLIDYVVSLLYPGLNYDPDGEIGRRGSVDHDLLKDLLRHEFITRPPPKTTGREVFGIEMARDIIKRGFEKKLSKEDIVATVTAFTVYSIIKNYDLFILNRYKIDEVVLGGGGVRNRFLMEMLERELRERRLKILFHEDLGIDSKIKEALGIAVLAHETLSGVPNNIVGATGAHRYVVMGEIIP
jgi:anhydro-N-acetylmuramic acid kinase